MYSSLASLMQMMKASGNKSWQSSLRIWLAAGGRYSLGYQPDMKQVSGYKKGNDW